MIDARASQKLHIYADAVCIDLCSLNCSKQIFSNLGRCEHIPVQFVHCLFGISLHSTSFPGFTSENPKNKQKGSTNKE